MEAPLSPELHIEFCYAPLPPEQVRWYSYRAPYDVKELSKATEVPHRGSLLRFCTADTLALETAYRVRRDELERCWWEEEAALQKGNGGASGGAAPAAADVAVQHAAGAPACDDWSYFMGSCEGEEAGVPVRSGAFEVDLPCRQLRPCYWPAGRHRVLRGTWFTEKGGEWVPIKESVAEQIEEGYRQAIWLPARGRVQQQAQGGYAARLDLTTNVEKGLYALFVSEAEVFLCQETGWGWLRKIGASATAGQQRLRLRRGYEQPISKALLEKEADLRQEELDEASAATPVSRLVLVVHGIGQNLAAANIAQDAGSFRSVLRQVAQDQSQAGLLDEQAASGRTEVLPVQWRKQLHIEADQLSRQLMPPGIPSLRQVLHNTVVEILLFMTPHHRAEIIASLITSLNSTYTRFLARNPGFNGSVSILAHSLGTVLCYDILCNQAAALPPTGHPVGAAAAAAAAGAAAAGGTGPADGSGPASPSQQPMLTSQPGSPEAQQQGQGQQQQRGKQQQQQSPSTPGGAELLSPVGSGASGGGGEEGMLIDLAVDSPSSVLHQELARLRAENQLLRLQLTTSRAQGGQGGEAVAAAGPGWQQQQQQFGAGHTAADADTADMAVAWPPLHFGVDQLILMGSPLGCFLALRGVSCANGLGLGTPASAPLMQLAPGQPVSPDGLPAVTRLLNVYHPYDPVAHRLEPLARPAAAVHRAALVPLFKGGKRIHLAVQEFSEDMGSAASRFGTSLLSSLAFAKFKNSAVAKEASKEDGGGGSSAAAAAAAAEVAAAEAEAAAEEEAARQLPGNSKSSPALHSEPSADVYGGGREVSVAGRDGSGRLYASLSFGVLDDSSADLAAAAATSTEASYEPTSLTASPRLAGSLRAASGSGAGAARLAPAGGIARVADGLPAPGAKSAQGRLDFVLQESSLENQYLSALSAHFGYWTSPDMALFVLRAVHDMDVLTGTSKHPAAAAAAAELPAPFAAAAGAGAAAGGGGSPPAPPVQQQQPQPAGSLSWNWRSAGRQGEVDPTSPRQHFLALP